MYDAVLRVRINSEVKRQAEELYRGMGTTFAEAVRAFAQRSVLEQGNPLALRSQNNHACGARGSLRIPRDVKAKLADKTPEEIRSLEMEAWPQAAMEKQAGLMGIK